MGINIDSDIITEYHLAGDNEGVGIYFPLPEGNLWSCLVCGLQGIRLPDGNEPPAPNHWASDVAPRCGHISGLASLYWCVQREGASSQLLLEVWQAEGGKIRRKVCRKSCWYLEGFEEALHLFQDLQQAAKDGNGVDGVLARAGIQPELPF